MWSASLFPLPVCAAVNWFSCVDLGAGLLAGVAWAVFVVRAWPLTRSRPHLLFSIALLLMCAFLLLWAVAENQVPAGQPAVSIPNASADMLCICRAIYSAAILFTAVLLHFAIEYTQRFRFTAWRITAFYLFFLAACGVYLRSGLLKARTAPLAETSSWKVTVPWMPDVTAAALLLTGVWLVVIAGIQFLIWTTPGHRMDSTTIGLVVTGLAGAALGLDGAVNYNGVVIGSLVMLCGLALTARGLLSGGPIDAETRPVKDASRGRHV